MKIDVYHMIGCISPRMRNSNDIKYSSKTAGERSDDRDGSILHNLGSVDRQIMVT